MKVIFAVAVCVLMPCIALAASKTYTFGSFESVSVAAGIAAEIKIGAPQSVVAETDGTNFDDLWISVEGNVLRIGRPPGNWFALHHPDYKVHIVMPKLYSLAASSGASAGVVGSPQGDFVVAATSSGQVSLPALKGANVSAHASSGGDVAIGGSCVSLIVSASSGGDVKADGLRCETVVAHASSGGDVWAYASKSIEGHASSGGGIRVDGKPPVVQVSQSSGGTVFVAK
ncbi:MAG TPA: DUF2807 domain-containing protein [Alphaproteobacteria bacterium]|nr:DUF2807 domain-containing protein [Alphaproteobacteria bacterium]